MAPAVSPPALACWERRGVPGTGSSRARGGASDSAARLGWDSRTGSGPVRPPQPGPLPAAEVAQCGWRGVWLTHEPHSEPAQRHRSNGAGGAEAKAVPAARGPPAHQTPAPLHCSGRCRSCFLVWPSLGRRGHGSSTPPHLIRSGAVPAASPGWRGQRSLGLGAPHRPQGPAPGHCPETGEGWRGLHGVQFHHSRGLGVEL